MLSISYSDDQKEKGVYIIEMQNRDCLKLGRTEECDIRL
jgi:hypothetical protein